MQPPNTQYEINYSYQHEPFVPRRQRLLQKFMSGHNRSTIYTLFILTTLSTFAAGLYLHGTYTAGIWYSFGIMSILYSHEMGHYLMCKKYGVPATLPYFIPIPPPLNPFGTMGAVIRMQGRMANRKMLFDIGGGGPLAGLVLVIPYLYWGLAMSKFTPEATTAQSGLYLGESLLFKGIAWLVIGDNPEHYDIFLHPLAYAGWAGLFVTALNLLPIGQLDGGHVVYALLGRKTRYIYPVSIAGFTLLCVHFYLPWIVLVIILVWVGSSHPETIDDSPPLDLKRRLIAWFLFVVFFLSFTPQPFQFIE
ncbi:MAG: site-2 protease family protein [Deferribacteres bacterium]|nr:site-2 protease family protein [candidate division KSB1 bacterium]MCB9503691.1 site-2 protease family protein [Deferribacteres bacterium]